MEINPVKATLEHNPNAGIQELNNTCYGVCTSFAQSGNVWSISPKCANQCNNLVEAKKKEIYGVGYCDHQAPYRPLELEEIPRYFPSLLYSGLSKEQALNQCKQQCSTLRDDKSDECIDKCSIDFNAIITRPKIKVEAKLPNKKDKGMSTEQILIIIGVVVVFLIFAGIYASK